MTGWTTMKDIRASLIKDWERGIFLRAAITGEKLFPLRRRLKGPKSGEIAEKFTEIKSWSGDWSRALENNGIQGLSLEYREVSPRNFGKNRLPDTLVFEDQESLLAFLHLENRFRQFQRISELVMERFDVLRDWIAKSPFKILEYAEDWPGIIAICLWLQKNPRPGIYLRQIDIDGVDTKFIETRKALLAEIFDLILPERVITKEFKGLGGFEQRYGFKIKPSQVRFKILDMALSIGGLTDLQIRSEEFAGLNLPAKKVFITENEINGLAFPEMADSIVIFGLGYGLERLADVAWLKNLEIYYWGDIDTHGFAMLDQLRSYFPQVCSFLMDRQTLLSNRQFWVTEPKQTIRNLKRLTTEESEVYGELTENCLGMSVRLEQERVPFSSLIAFLEMLKNRENVPGCNEA